MKTIGLIGGMSWESSSLYYQIINREIQQRLGGVHSSKCIMYSVDFGEIAKLQHDADWDRLGLLMADAARSLEKGGADCIVLCTNTMHKLAENITASVSIPLLHIADGTAKCIQNDGIEKVGLLATKFTMEGEFMRNKYLDHGIITIIPNKNDRQIVHDIIYHELVKGIVLPSSLIKYQNIIDELRDRGAQGIISGCTEIELLVRPQDIAVPLYETTKIHANAAVDWALG